MRKNILKEYKKEQDAGTHPEMSIFQQGLYAGMGWAVGVTVGFALLSVILVLIFRALGGLPIIGGWVATLVEITLDQLGQRAPNF